MQKILISVAVALSIVALCAGTALSARTGKVDPDAEGVPIYVSPHVIVLDGEVSCVTVHADIPLSEVVNASVELNGLTPYLVKRDSRGLLVAKFHMADVEEIVAPPTARLTLTGMTTAGVAFSGSETVRVK